MIGYIDSIRARTVAGWAVDGDEPVRVSILLNGEPIGLVLADRFREDLMHAGYGDGRHAYEFLVPEHLWLTGSISAQIVGGPVLTNGAEAEQLRHKEMFMVSPLRGYPSPPWILTRKEVGPEDLEVANELIKIWRRIREGVLDLEGIWAMHIETRQRDIIAPLEAGDVERVASVFVSLPREMVTDGMYQGRPAYEALMAASDLGRSMDVALYHDALLALGQYLGDHVECPEQGEFGSALHQDSYAVKRAIEEKLGFGSITPPLIFDGLFGLCDGLNIRDIQGLYAALRVASITRGHVCEVGGGVGRAAYFAVLLGISKYTIVDLPLICLLQYFVLRRSLPDISVTVDGDGKINLLPAWSFPSGYDLVLNCDSFPEMGSKVVSDYSRKINSPILSINQEAAAPLTADINGPRQVVVGDVLSQRFEREYRFPCWVRKGYVEELWKPRQHVPG